MDLGVIMTYMIFGIPLILTPFVIAVGFIKKNYSMYLGVTAVFLSFLASVYVFYNYTMNGIYLTNNFNWFAGSGLYIPLGVIADNLSIIMSLMVSFVGLMIILFSVGYMAEDPRRHVFFGEMVLFTASMLGLVLSSSILMLFIFWELVGLCSYLLIGFWFYKPNAAAAAKKAFIVTRVGDVFFIAGIAAAFYYSNGQLLISGLNSIPYVWQKTIVSLLLFGGAIGKSAQFPLHVWIPDAMEGPTTVSALIHAATMVTAGVYLVARTYSIFTPESLAVVLFIGVFTVILSGLLGLVVNDIKRILAYSTISQIGYMVSALGLNLGFASIAMSIYQLESHAFFKALLFLSAGSILHAMLNVRDVNKMGGLWKKMPITITSMFIGALALSGFPYTAGFFSKDSIITASYSVSFWAWLFLVIGAFLTSMYTFRLFFKVALGKPKSYAAEHAHESNLVMIIPILILAIFSLIFGVFQGGFYSLLGYHPISIGYLDWVPVILMLLGMGISYLLYGKESNAPQRIANGLGFIYKLVKNKFYIDVLYTNVIAERAVLGLSGVADGFERKIIDGFVNTWGEIAKNAGSSLRKIQTGVARHYVILVVGGLAIILFLIRILMILGVLH